MVTITLPDDIEAWAKEKVAAGRAKNVEDFVADTLREQKMFDAHRPLVEEAYRQMEMGEGVDEAELDAVIDGWFKKDAHG